MKVLVNITGDDGTFTESLYGGHSSALTIGLILAGSPNADLLFANMHEICDESANDEITDGSNAVTDPYKLGIDL